MNKTKLDYLTFNKQNNKWKVKNPCSLSQLNIMPRLERDLRWFLSSIVINRNSSISYLCQSELDTAILQRILRLKNI